MEFDNVMQDMSTHLGPGSDLDKILGKLKVTIELNDDNQSNKSNKKLKYAPISKLAIEINQDKAIEQDGFLPINANLEFVINQIKRYKMILNSYRKYLHILKKLQITISRKTNLNFHLLNPDPLDFPDHPNLTISDYSFMQILKFTSSKKSKQDYMVILLIIHKSEWFRFIFTLSWLCSYKKDFLVKWLAFDYIMSNKNITKYLLKDLLNDEKVDELMDQRRSKIKKLLTTNKEKKILDDSNPMIEVINEVTSELGNMDLDLNLIMAPEREIDSEIWLHIEKFMNSKKELTYRFLLTVILIAGK